MSFDTEMSRINRRVGQLVKKGERDVAKKYAGALLEMRAILAKQYELYERGGELTLNEMLKHDRLKKMMREIKFLMRTHYKDVDKTMVKVLGETYLDGYYLTAHAVENEVLTNLGYVAVTPETLTAMTRNPVAGLTLNERLELQRRRIIRQIQSQVTQGLRNNETYSTMAKRLKQELEGDATKAMRIVRTEGHRVSQAAITDSAIHANKNGVIMMKTWNTLEDRRVRRKRNGNHQKLNNKTIPVDEDFVGETGRGPSPGNLGSPSEDINCRCFTTFSIKGIEKPQREEVEKITFEKWKNERLQDR